MVQSDETCRRDERAPAAEARTGLQDKPPALGASRVLSKAL